MSRLVTNAIRSTAASSDAMTIDSAGKPSFPNGGVGKILQVVSTTKTDVFSESLASGAFSADAMSLSITPSSASNKILIAINCFLGVGATVRLNATIYKAGSVLTGSIGDADGSKNRTSFQASNSNAARGNTAGGTYLDTAGGTSAITYSVRLSHGHSSTQTIYLNRVHTENDNDDYSRSASTITLTEVAA
tara:strand:+ start:1872 stop:2444 length:573 start_codon:yes stop_codon:yes gene_type:complete